MAHNGSGSWFRSCIAKGGDKLSHRCAASVVAASTRSRESGAVRPTLAQPGADNRAAAIISCESSMTFLPFSD